MHSPIKKFKNFQESFVLLNLQAVYVIRLLYLADDDTTGMIMVATGVIISCTGKFYYFSQFMICHLYGEIATL